MTIISRLARGNKWPNFLKNEMQCKHRYSKSINLPQINGQIRFRRERKYRIGDGPPYHKDDTWVKTRECFGWLIKNHRRVGGIQLVEYEFSPLIDNYSILNIMDRNSIDDLTVAKMLTTYWKDFDIYVTPYGTIVELRSVWIDQRVSKPGLVGSAVNALFSQFSEDYAIMILKAFPLEYDDSLQGNSLLETGFQKRQRAMLQYYNRCFGVQPLPSIKEYEGWMWKPSQRAARTIPQPRTT